MKTHHALYTAVAVLLLAGCGGGDSDVPQTTPVRVAIHWAARSRNLDAPSSALSTIITLKEANPDGTDFQITLNRHTNTAEYTETYSSPETARVGNWPLQVRFFAEADGGGGVVGSAQATITLNADGSGIGTISTVNSVAAVEIPTGQEVEVNYRKDISFTTRDASGSIVAVSPGSAFWQVVSGEDILALIGGQAEGRKIGSAAVAVTVDGKTSSTVPVNVIYRLSDFAGKWAGTWQSVPAGSSSRQGSLFVTINADGAVTGTLRSQNNLSIGGLTTNGQDASLTGTLSKTGNINITTTYPGMPTETVYTCTGVVPLAEQVGFTMQYAGGGNNVSGSLAIQLSHPGSTNITVQ